MDIYYTIRSYLLQIFNKNNKKHFKIKMKEDVGMSKPKKHADKVGIVITQEVNVGPKIKQTTSI